ncbi:hypothetical protein BKA70DRAFT_1352800 [Coprinopsis sp. MPI-PUGE-AT-0042]|nr:hypothetical protein BKA70DRAFT_1352800 [Coprinopsis sp. MPI-PUGE-AT-0042]
MVEALEREIEALTRVRNSIVEGQKAIRIKRRHYEAGAAAIRRTSPEILATIIQFALGGPYGLLHHEERVFFAHIRSVCRLWSQTSFSTPSLWRAVGLDIGQTLTNKRHAIGRSSIGDNLTPWFLRAGVDAPLRLQVYGPLPSTPLDIINFAGGSGFNITMLDFSTPVHKQSIGMLSYDALRAVSQLAKRPLPLKNLTFEFQHYPHFRPSSRDFVNLTPNFPSLANLTLIESIVPHFRFPLMISHASLALLQLIKLALTSKDMSTILFGLPRLQKLYLERCKTHHVHTSCIQYTHMSLEVLILSATIPEACFCRLACPALTTVRIDTTPSTTLHRPDNGQTFGQFMRRCGRINRFYISGESPPGLLHTILKGNTEQSALFSVGVELFSSFNVSSKNSRHVVKIPTSLSAICIEQEATESQFVEFCHSIALEDGRELVVTVPECKPWTSAYFPWPRPANGRNYVFCHSSDVIGYMQRAGARAALAVP